MSTNAPAQSVKPKGRFNKFKPQLKPASLSSDSCSHSDSFSINSSSTALSASSSTQSSAPELAFNNKIGDKRPQSTSVSQPLAKKLKVNDAPASDNNNTQHTQVKRDSIDSSVNCKSPANIANTNTGREKKSRRQKKIEAKKRKLLHAGMNVQKTNEIVGQISTFSKNEATRSSDDEDSDQVDESKQNNQKTELANPGSTSTNISHKSNNNNSKNTQDVSKKQTNLNQTKMESSKKYSKPNALTPAKSTEKEYKPFDTELQNSHLSELQKKMQAKLQGGQFRWLNEKLYTCKGNEAFALLQNEPSLFDVYHRGFRTQVEKWPVNPVDVFIKFLKAHPTLVVGDFGCGDAKIAQVVSNKVHSFDLVSRNKYVTACDISKVPLPDQCLDVAIFSLALMGTNCLDFVNEARRVLKIGGSLKIAEVRSRFGEMEGGVDKFIQAVCALGFEKVRQDARNKMFIMLDFVKTDTKPTNKLANTDQQILKACIYKRR
jgi:ribosomal RNA-processing protein 8